MKAFFKIVLLLLLPVVGMAQDAVNITPTLFNENGQYYIGTANGWLYKQGNDTAWARKDIDASGWGKLAPVSISAKYADKNGRVEGWFRIKIKIDNTFTDGSLGIKSSSWAATDIYVDGQLVTSYGNSGINGMPYREGGVYGHPAITIPVKFKPGTEHIIALHFVDFVAPLPPLRLKSEDVGLIGVVSITRLNYNSNLIKGVVKDNMFEAIWISVCTVLSLLFWMIAIQNPLEKNLKLIATGSTFLTLAILFGVLGEFVGLSYFNWLIISWLQGVFVNIATILTLLIIVRIFERKVTKALKIFLGINFILFEISALLPQDIDTLINAVVLVAVLGLDLYYIISSWKRLRGAQWAIVIGLMTSLFFAAVYFYMNALVGHPSIDAIQLSITGYSLAFPLSLLVYVSMRFKEIITEVRVNAAQVVQLSEEKKEEALNRQKVLQQEVERQTAEIRTTLDNLKATQTQLVQSEKMASLGELTAGIAHEIQNPLNFVNNFSEVNKEMVAELEEELKAGNIEEALAIASDIKANEEKINHHGKRADFIVKGMLQHSRTSTGEKQETNINILADEFFKLSYHGLRAKDKNFNAEMVTHFNEDLPKVNIAQQDIGRVLLNLFNNAFYAVNQKQKTAGADYKPEVIVSTSIDKNNLVIKVKDNGNGIPDAIKEKIMQPFFTTKPTGEGTGLGLSLSYDIVVKGHGGSIDVNSKEGEFTEFIILLPLK
jgi:two-component system NtrC family sensor kinase